jgi:hypothetical protein
MLQRLLLAELARGSFSRTGSLRMARCSWAAVQMTHVHLDLLVYDIS